MKSVIFLILLLIVLLINAFEKNLPQIIITVNDESTSGYVYVSNFKLSGDVDNTPYLLILNNDGTPVWQRQMSSPLNLDFKLQPNGLATYYDYNQKKFYGLDKNFTIVDSFACVGYQTDEHELRILPNGNFVLFGIDFRVVDMSQFMPNGLTNAVVLGIVLQEQTPDREVVFEWNSLDPGHYAITDCTQQSLLLSPVVDYAHCNAIEIDDDGNFVISARHLDEISKIDRITGDFIWRIGGSRCVNNQFTFIDDEIFNFTGFSHQHGIRKLSDGNWLLFDNANLKLFPNSRAVEYEIDEINFTITKKWEFYHTPHIQTSAMGFAQRLDNSNTLICWGSNDDNVTATEVNQNGVVVWEMTFPENIYSYRAFRFPTIGGDFLLTPEAPESVQIQISNDSLILNWQPVINATGYKIYCSDTFSGNYADISDTGEFGENSWSTQITDVKSRFYHVRTIKE